MKYTFITFITIISLVCSFSLYAQVDTKGTDFWVTFGQNYTNGPTGVTLQVRLVGSPGTTVTLWFTETSSSQTLTIPSGGVVTYNLTIVEKTASYCQANGNSNKSIHITASSPVTVYAFNSMDSEGTCDATNLLPVPTLGSDYYYLGYASAGCYSPTGADAYAIIATQDNTQVYHNDVLKTTLNKGQVYYFKESPAIELTGAHITTTKPAALFSVNVIACVPNGSGDNLFQQLASVNTWGKTFLVPKVAKSTADRVRIVASQNGTTITQVGGTIIKGSLNLNAGQYLELQLSVGGQGCYIVSDKPVAVGQYINIDPSLAWIPAIDQRINNALIAPFVPVGNTYIDMHRASIVAPTATKNNTTISIAGSAPQALSGGTWIDNTASGHSYYDMQLTNTNGSYQFANQAGIIVFGYGYPGSSGNGSSYHYVAGSGLRNLDAAFYVNNIHNQDLASEVICTQPTQFRAEITGAMSATAGHLKWYINNVEETTARDQLTWSKTLANGTYQVKMIALSDDDVTTKTVEAMMTVSSSCAGLVTPSSSTVCFGTNSTTLTLSGYWGTITKWQSSVSPFSTWTDIANTTTTLTATNLTQTTQYRAVINGVNITDPATITVSSCAGTITASCETVCEGAGSVTLTLGSYTGTITKWQYAYSPFSTWVDINETTENLVVENLPQTARFRAVINSSTYSDPITITTQPKPTVSITGATAICAGSTSQLSPTSGGTWVSNNTAVATVTNAGVVTGVSSGSVTFTYTRDGGCSASITP